MRLILEHCRHRRTEQNYADNVSNPKIRPSPLLRLLKAITSSPGRALFLDIETTGFSHKYDDITLIGWAFGGQFKTIIHGQEHHRLAEDMENASCLVTFNGTAFDNRFLKAKMPDLPFPPDHIDLMHLCRQSGLTGGQKAIEQILGISVRDGIEAVNGYKAVSLWSDYLKGDRSALERLVIYNRADVAAMGAILDETLKRMKLPQSVHIGRVKFRDWAGAND